MLAQAERPTHDFFALARYLVQGKARPVHPDRVAWVLAHNLPSNDPELAATFMGATAQLSARCQSACYHLMVTWHPDEKPDEDVMREVAMRTLELAGLGEHQALVMGHGDKPHRHLHMMINRVHPETGRAWSTRHDYRRLDAIMRQLAGEFGFAHVPGHRFDPEGTEALPRKPNSRATYAAKRGAKTQRTQWSRAQSRAFAERISERLDAASSWEDLEAAFAEHGLALEPKGKGHVVGNAVSYTKLSRLGLRRTAKGFTRKPVKAARAKPTSRSPALFAVDAVDIARAIGSRTDVRQAVQEVVRKRHARLARAPLMVRLLEGLRETLRGTTALSAPRQSRRRVPRRPAQSRSARDR